MTTAAQPAGQTSSRGLDVAERLPAEQRRGLRPIREIAQEYAASMAPRCPIPEVRRLLERMGQDDWPTAEEVADAKHTLAQGRTKRQGDLLRPE
jgi:hypothetical protein